MSVTRPLIQKPDQVCLSKLDRACTSSVAALLRKHLLVAAVCAQQRELSPSGATRVILSIDQPVVARVVPEQRLHCNLSRRRHPLSNRLIELAVRVHRRAVKLHHDLTWQPVLFVRRHHVPKEIALVPLDVNLDVGRSSEGA